MLHRKAIEYCSPNRAGNTTAGSFTVSDKSNVIPEHNTTYYIGGVSAIWNYSSDEDAWLQIKNSGIAGTFAAGSCGEFRALSAPAGAIITTASAGTATTITTALNIVRSCSGYRILVVAGAGVGYCGEIFSNTLGANAVLTLRTASTVSFDNTTQFQILGGSVWFFNAGTTAVGFSVYDRITDTWTARSVTGLPAAWGTSAQLVATSAASSNWCNLVYENGTATSGSANNIVDTSKSFPVNAYQGLYKVVIVAGTGKGQARLIVSNTSDTIVVDYAWSVVPDSSSVYELRGVGFDRGAASSATSTTLVDSTKTWPVSGFVNYQIRIYAGTGIGQTRSISASTATSVTVSTAWTIVPDTTSRYVIEGNDDYMYLLGNNAVVMYRYTVSTNTWSTIVPTVARAGAYATGGTVDWIDSVTGWENNYKAHTIGMIKQLGRYFYCFRGGATSTLDVYDIAANTWISAVSYAQAAETFTTSSCSFDTNSFIYIQKDATGVIFRFDINKNVLEPCLQSPMPQGTAVVSDRMFVEKYNEDDQELYYLYSLSCTRNELVRWLLV